jgi:ribosome maturation factor RimP
MSHFIESISNLIEPTINDLGFDLVKIIVRNIGTNVVLELLVEPNDGTSLTIAQCRTISNNVSALLDVEDIISDKYYLEVSSPGVERPLVKLKDYQRFIGRAVRIRLKKIVDGASHYKGIVSKVVEDPQTSIYIQTDDGKEVAIPFDMIKGAHLVITDEMFRKMMKR